MATGFIEFMWCKNCTSRSYHVLRLQTSYSSHTAPLSYVLYHKIYEFSVTYNHEPRVIIFPFAFFNITSSGLLVKTSYLRCLAYYFLHQIFCSLSFMVSHPPWETPAQGFISSPFYLLIRLSSDDWPPWRSERDGRGCPRFPVAKTVLTQALLV